MSCSTPGRSAGLRSQTLSLSTALFFVLTSMTSTGASSAAPLSDHPARVTATTAAVASPGFTPAIGWGASNDGQVTTSTSRLLRPTTTLLPAQTTALALGRQHSLALTADGTVYSWGADDRELLGAEAVDRSASPGPLFRRVDVPAGVVIRSIATDAGHSLALSTDGTVYSWGQNSEGQLGTDDAARAAVMPVSGLPTIAAIATGEHHSIAIADDGSVFTWGANTEGQLGRPTEAPQSSVPGPVTLPDGARAAEAAAGGRFSLIRTTDGRIVTWGANGAGQLGDGTRIGRSQPAFVALPQGRTATRVVAGGGGATLLTDQGSVLAWGDNRLGQVGDGSTADRLSPVAVTFPPGTTVTDLSRAGDHTLALTDDSRLFGWGDNSWGQIGDGTVVVRTGPTPVATDPGDQIVTVAAGFGHDLAVVASDGLDHLTVDTKTPVAAVDETIRFRVDGFDAAGHWLGPITADAVLDIESGTCTGDLCRSAVPGQHAVTARIGVATGRNFVRITGGATTPSGSPPPATSSTPPTGTAPSSTPTAVTGTGTSTTGVATGPLPPTVPGSSRPAADPVRIPAVDSPLEQRAFGDLSSTGAGAWVIPAFLAAVLAIVGGGLLTVVGRRRRNSSSSTDRTFR